MWRLILCPLLMVVACGPAQAQPSTSPAAATAGPSPSTSASPLFAVLEATIPGSQYEWNTVAIAGLDGYARAKTTFTPMPVPDIGCMGAILPQSAQVAAGRVYFADGKGVVRSLSVTGQVTQVAAFPLTSSQQMLSFAVSPDGSELLGTVFTLPAKPNLACNGSAASSGYSLSVYSAKAGGSSTLLYHESLPTGASLGWAPPPIVMALTGWDAVGPFGTYPTAWASQGGGPGSDLGVAVRIDASTGKVLRQVADPNSCLVWDIGASGDFTCIPDGVANVSVRRPDGSEIWQTSGSHYWNFLSPDEQHIVAASDATGLEVLGRDGTRVKLGSGYGLDPAGWLDSTTVIGGVGPNPLAYVGLSAPSTIVSLGFKVLFVGTVHT
jgi:hypothetical protein